MSNRDQPSEYDSIRVTVTPAERELLLKTFHVPLDAQDLDQVQLQFLITHRRINEIESAALRGLKKRTGNPDTMKAEPGTITPHASSMLIERLCATYGFCLAPLWKARLVNCPPQSVQKYTDTIFLAEGLDPGTADSDLYKSILSEVRTAFAGSS